MDRTLNETKQIETKFELEQLMQFKVQSTVLKWYWKSVKSLKLYKVWIQFRSDFQKILLIWLESIYIRSEFLKSLCLPHKQKQLYDKDRKGS